MHPQATQSPTHTTRPELLNNLLRERSATPVKKRCIQAVEGCRGFSPMAFQLPRTINQWG